MPAQDPSLPGGVVDSLLRQGPLGAIVIALAALAWWLIRREAARADEGQRRADDAQRQLNDLHASIRQDIVPAVVKAAEVLSKVGELLPDVVSALRDHDRGRR